MKTPGGTIGFEFQARAPKAAKSRPPATPAEGQKGGATTAEVKPLRKPAPT